MRHALVVVLFGVALGVVACDSQTPTAAKPSATPVTLFDPCSQIPDGILQRGGVDPGSKESGIAGVEQPGWKICGWRGAKYHLTVFSTTRSVAEFEKKPGNTDFRDISTAGRTGRQFRVEGASKDLRCDAIFPTRGQTIQLMLVNNAAQDNLQNPCTLLSQVSAVIVPILPA